MPPFYVVRKGTYSPTWNELEYMVGGTHKYISLLSEYLDVVEELGRKTEKARTPLIEWYKEIYSKPSDIGELEKKIQNVNDRANEALQSLASIPSTIVPLYKKIIEECYHKDDQYNMVPLYNRGLIRLLEGDADGSLEDINLFIEIAKKNGEEHLLDSRIFQRQGESFLEVGLYHDAISSLTEAIDRDPKNLEAYFQRSSAYFEIGDFDHSLSDYLNSNKLENFVPVKSAPIEFINAFASSVIEGSKDALCDFIPSLCYTAYGLGECLWTFGEHPIDSVNHLANTSYEIGEHIVDYLKTVDREKISEYATELVSLYERFDELSNNEKGHLIGYTLGKYGTDIFAGSAVLKGVVSFKKLREANRICNLESMALSASSKEAIASSALKQYSERCKFFEKSKIHWGKQNKHIPGTNNYKGGNSIFLHKDANKLLKEHASKGVYKRGEMGKPGYKEVVDFNEPIGIWKNKKGESLPTTKGTIHYSKDGAHIVPAHPESKIW